MQLASMSPFISHAQTISTALTWVPSALLQSQVRCVTRCALPATNGMANLPRLLLPGAGLGWEAQQPLQAGQLLLVDNALAILHGQQVSSRSPRVWHHAALAQPTIMLAGMAGP